MRELLERMITKFSRDGDRCFFEPEAFSWVRQVEAGWRDIRGEVAVLLANKKRIPNFQDISREQANLASGEQWKTFFLYGYGHRVRRNCGQCPRTERLLMCIPGMKTAMFSILAPGTHVPPHRGPYKGVLRYHLGLIIPAPNTSCRIRVGKETRFWEEGKSLIFDDSHIHEVWNSSDQDRVVLFVDFIRPLPLVLSVPNCAMIWRISKMPFVTDAAKRVESPGLVALEKFVRRCGGRRE